MVASQPTQRDWLAPVVTTAEYFDQWYADIDASPRRRQIFAEELDLPPEVEPSSFVPIDGMEQIAAWLAVPAGGVLVDLACGRGGPGMWLARNLQARLVGVDFAPVAVAQARERRSVFGLDDQAEFVVGTLLETGLDSGIADALICIDAVQFAEDAAAAAAEMRRVLKSGGRVALTSWEAVDRGDERMPARLRELDLAGALATGGFVEVSVANMPKWRERERRFWARVQAMPADGDPAIQSLHEEAAVVVPAFDAARRVLATGRAPL